MQQQQNDMMENMKRNFNIAHFFLLIHQRGLIIPLRNRFGVEAFGIHTLFALVMMVLWASFAHDEWMLWYVGIWLLFLAHRRMQSLRLARTERRQSQYDGFPMDAIKFCKDEHKAKLIVEPIIVGLIGYGLLWYYQQQGWDYRGLPYFFLFGVFSLPMVEGIKQTGWKRRVQSMADARLEQEAAMRDFKQQWGDEP
jgi:hypothetical protein